MQCHTCSVRTSMDYVHTLPLIGDHLMPEWQVYGEPGVAWLLPDELIGLP